MTSLETNVMQLLTLFWFLIKEVALLYIYIIIYIKLYIKNYSNATSFIKNQNKLSSKYHLNCHYESCVAAGCAALGLLTTVPFSLQHTGQ